MWQIEFFETEDGKAPVQKFLDGLDIKMRAKALKEIMILKELGTAVREPYSKPIDNGLLELRIKFSSNITRIFYFFFVGNKIVLTNGFIKKDQKTPKSEIEKAFRYKADYERRYTYD